mmetsp:Transcript_72477/g.136892  ORF Transcript_72477/g.136892 Transcript_72477/m.136892 type:complete len:375 (-) Transcript_72477:19-1143(-)
MGATLARRVRRDNQQVHQRGQGSKMPAPMAAAAITSLLGALPVVGASIHEDENVIAPSVAILRLVENFDMHLQQFTDIVQEEANQQEKSWLRLGSEIDRVLARLELPLDASEEELETTTAPRPEQDDLPEWKPGKDDAAGAGSNLDGQDDEEPSGESQSNANQASDASHAEGEQLASNVVDSSSRGTTEVSTKSTDSAPNPTSSSEADGYVDRHRSGSAASSSTTEASSSTSVAPRRRYLCAPGQGQLVHRIAISHHNREHACAEECDKYKDCHGFDYTHVRASDACRMYEANKPRHGHKNSGPAHRQYCALQQQAEEGFREPSKKQHIPSGADYTRSHQKRPKARTDTNPAKNHPKSHVKSADTQSSEEVFLP